MEFKIFQLKDENKSIRIKVKIIHLEKLRSGKMYKFTTLAKTELLYPKNAGAQVAMDFT